MDFDLAAADRQRFRRWARQAGLGVGLALLHQLAERRLPSGAVLLLLAAVGTPTALWWASRRSSGCRRVTVSSTAVRLYRGHGVASLWRADDGLEVQFNRRFDVTLADRQRRIAHLRAPDGLLAPWVEAWFPLWWRCHRRDADAGANLNHRGSPAGLVLSALLGMLVCRLSVTSAALPAGGGVLAGLLAAAGSVVWQQHHRRWSVHGDMLQTGLGPWRRRRSLAATLTAELDLEVSILVLHYPEGPLVLPINGDWAGLDWLVERLPCEVTVTQQSLGGGAWWRARQAGGQRQVGDGDPAITVVCQR